MNKNLKTKRLLAMGFLSLMMALFAMTSCDSSANIEDSVQVTKSDPYDSSKPVTISSFTPGSGGVGQQLVIYGTNFGNDTSIVKVTIGGKNAVLVSVTSGALYCYVPAGAFTGEVEVTVGANASDQQTAVATEKFDYQRKMVAGTLCGWQNARDDQGWIDGSFATSCGFRNDGVMRFSPYNHNQLFIVYDQEPSWTGGHGIQLLDLAKKEVNTVLPVSMFSNERLRTVDFAVDPYAYNEAGTITGVADAAWAASATSNQTRWKEHLIIAADNYNSDYRAHCVYIIDRDANGDFSSGSAHRLLACYNQCNGASLHPNGELYFSSYTNGEVMRLDMSKYWDTLVSGVEWNPYARDNLHDINTDTSTGTGAFEDLFTVQDTGWEFQIDIHPSGKYAYIVVINQHYMLRTDYNEATHRFAAPYVIAGKMKTTGFTDGVGQSAAMNRPYQGTFVKNDAYVKEGRDDIYDFYFCDSQNNALRCLSPEGIVTTYAGGNANSHADGKTYGSENGALRDVARFNRPTGLVNDVHKDAISGENTLIFYILDTKNARIRTITMEENADATAAKPAVK
jgi:hypothetical protein